MLFYITSELVLLAQTDDLALRVLNNLGLSRLDGANIVLADRESLNLLRQMPKLDDSARRAYQDTYLKSTTLHSIFELIDIQFYVTIDEKESIKVGEKRIIKVPYSDLDKRSLFNGAAILLENFSEKYLYDHILDWYRKTNDLTSIKYKYNILNGGGNCISDYFSYLQNSNEVFCLAIVDSDRKYPDGPCGQTASQLEKVPKKTFICDYLMLNVRECENLAPLNILKEVCQGDPNWENAYGDVENIHKTNANCLLFLDYKKGLKEKNLHSYTDTMLNDYLKKILRDSQLLNEEEFRSIKERTEESFEEKNQIIIHPLGNNVLDRIVENLNLKSKQGITLTEFNPEFLIQEWERIGNVLLNWTCSLPHIA